MVGYSSFQLTLGSVDKDAAFRRFGDINTGLLAPYFLPEHRLVDSRYAGAEPTAPFTDVQRY